MLTFRDIASGFSGLRAILRFDIAALRHFDGTAATFAKSFVVALILAPVFAVMVGFDIQSGEVKDPERYALLQAAAYLVGWVAFPLLLLPVSRYLGRGERYFAYISAYNWFSLVAYAVQLPQAGLAAIKVVPDQAIAILWLTTQSLLFLYQWFIARRFLEVEALPAAALVVIDFLLGLLIYKAAVVLA